MSNNLLLDAALAYADAGLPVFPCRPSKAPYTKGGFKNATTDPKTIARWWRKWPDASIGIPTGKVSGIIAIDADILDSWEGLVADQGGEPDTLQAKTGREGGGWHVLFKYPNERIRCTNGEIADGIDVKADGGYIIVAPSIHDSGTVYAWLDENYEPLAFADFNLEQFRDLLSEVPEWLLSLMRSPHARDADLSSEGRIPQGTRHNVLMSIAGTMRNCGMSAEEIEASLLIVNAHRCDPPLEGEEEEEEIHAIAEDAGGYAVGHAEASPVIINMADLEPEEVDWLWPDRIPRGELTIIVGVPGVAKSILTHYMASRITRGERWPDGALAPSGSVLLITSEDSPTKTIVPRLIAAEADVSKVNLVTLKRGRNKSGQVVEEMLTLADVAAIKQALDHAPDCVLLVIDPIGDYLGGRLDAHRENDVRAALRPIAKLAQERGIAVLLVAHPPKSVTVRADDAILGSRAFTGVARAVWHLLEDPHERGRRLFVPGKSNLAQQADGLAFQVTGPDGHPYIEWEDELLDLNADDVFAVLNEKGRPGPKPEKRHAARDWLIEFLGDEAFYVSAIKEAAIDAGLNWRTVQRAAEELGVVRWKDDDGHIWELPEDEE